MQPQKKGAELLLSIIHALARKKKKKNIVSGNGFSMHRPLEVKMLCFIISSKCYDDPGWIGSGVFIR